MQQRRRAAGGRPQAGANPGRGRSQPGARPARSSLDRGLQDYLVDLVVILVIAVLTVFALQALGARNYILTALVGLILGRVVVSLGRRYLF